MEREPGDAIFSHERLRNHHLRRLPVQGTYSRLPKQPDDGLQLSSFFHVLTFLGLQSSSPKAAKYVRLGPKTEMSKVKELLTEVWGLTRWSEMFFNT